MVFILAGGCPEKEGVGICMQTPSALHPWAVRGTMVQMCWAVGVHPHTRGAVLLLLLATQLHSHVQSCRGASPARGVGSICTAAWEPAGLFASDVGRWSSCVEF